MFAHWLSGRGLDEMIDIRQLQIAEGCSAELQIFLLWLFPHVASPHSWWNFPSFQQFFSNISLLLTQIYVFYNFRRTSKMGNSQCGLVDVRFVGKIISVKCFHVLETLIISGACRLWSPVSYHCRHCNVYRTIQFQPDKVNIKAIFRYSYSVCYKKRTEYEKETADVTLCPKRLCPMLKRCQLKLN